MRAFPPVAPPVAPLPVSDPVPKLLLPVAPALPVAPVELLPLVPAEPLPVAPVEPLPVAPAELLLPPDELPAREEPDIPPEPDVLLSPDVVLPEVVPAEGLVRAPVVAPEPDCPAPVDAEPCSIEPRSIRCLPSHQPIRHRSSAHKRHLL